MRCAICLPAPFLARLIGVAWLELAFAGLSGHRSVGASGYAGLTGQASLGWGSVRGPDWALGWGSVTRDRLGILAWRWHTNGQLHSEAADGKGRAIRSPAPFPAAAQTACARCRRLLLRLPHALWGRRALAVHALRARLIASLSLQKVTESLRTVGHVGSLGGSTGSLEMAHKWAVASGNGTRRALCRFACRRRFPQTFLILRVYKVPSHKVLKRDRPFVLANAAPAVISAWKWHINKRLYSVGVGMSDR
uniref:Secreted protein n=1 Tax=Globodera rostochiensis TaxID=31243 RepID=A0A914I5Q8_GLORO